LPVSAIEAIYRFAHIFCDQQRPSDFSQSMAVSILCPSENRNLWEAIVQRLGRCIKTTYFARKGGSTNFGQAEVGTFFRCALHILQVQRFSLQHIFVVAFLPKNFNL